ncbi:hypothetical protein BATDEDRAFT_14175 [Batrachochytrium dendrobatidis JAM81]|uniref:Uncharacterized protein n=1 Tax=Batrachochytrium dendrobatidis (strain JAM81 / FGSC 10211) TaxID=684364 RepID=F4PB69_BATDJ|nr:uncharacterized protein BATDEDRAFT_14175 [Batrachochytrium dendrobatidis JAM81]EGF77394.1 hypothetical protein BATDEDRAFT_14175 [Batrachochytrium dendrobatidis JAM81]|eukprot:XP_006681882.1 hypothetical protein BATDEDRAFT_14175 [Batrachochytrium dendrobatidis JAM81]
MYCSPCSLTIPVFGIDGAGKSSLIYRLKGACLGFINPIPFCCTKKKTIRMNLYDLGGLESIRAIWKNYLAEAHGYVYVIDGLDLTRLGESVQALKDIYSFPKMQGKPLLM